MPHHFHAARDRGADAIQGDPGQGANGHRERSNHFALQTETIAEQLEHNNGDDSDRGGQRDRQRDGKTKQRPAARPIADSLRARDERGDGVVESEDPDLADEIRGRPGNRKRSQGRWPKHARDEKCKDATEVRRQHRDGVKKGAAF